MMTLNTVAKAAKAYASDPQTLERARVSPKYFTRMRKMGFSEHIFFLLNQVNTSTRTALRGFFKRVLDRDAPMSQQALSKARSHFDHSPFQGLFDVVNGMRYCGEHEIRRWNGYQILAVDGSDITLPNSPALLETFGGSGRNADCPMAEGSIMLDILNDFIIDACLNPYGTSEREMALGHIDKLLDLCPDGDKLLIFDRGYPSLGLIGQLGQRNLRFLMRVKAGWNGGVDQAVGLDNRVTLSDGTIIRVIKLTLPCGETETLITNLFALQADQFGPLYFLRWPVETKYDIVKNKLSLENFSGISENVIRQDFWVCMLLANIVSVAKEEANVLVEQRRADKDNLYPYIPNTADLIASLKDEFVRACLEPSTRKRNKRIAAVIDEISRSVIPVRNGRSFPRRSPRKAKAHHNAKSPT